MGTAFHGHSTNMPLVWPIQSSHYVLHASGLFCLQNSSCLEVALKLMHARL